MKKIGVLALQGDFEAHQRVLARAGAEAVQVRTAAELRQVDGLVIPGGESTTMLKLLREEKLLGPVHRFGEQRPIFGTCAGTILIGVERNAYGRQLDSQVTRIVLEEPFLGRMGDGELEAVFIRAPIIRRVGSRVRVLARHRGDPVLVEQGLHLAATFHPELTGDDRVHRLFLEKLCQPRAWTGGNATCRT
jgi:5'-phosphate synthase pdxT subunit